MKSIKREGDILIPFLTVLSDAVCAELAFLFSYWLRFYSPATRLFPVTRGLPPFEAYVWSSLFAIIIWLLIFKSRGMYGARRHVGPLDEFSNVIKGVTIGLIVLMAATFFYREFSYSRVMFGFLGFCAVIFLWFGRILVLSLEWRLHRRGANVLRVALVGSGTLGHALFERIAKHPELGFRIIGTIGQNTLLEKVTPSLGSINQLPEIVQREKIDVVVAALSEHETPSLVALLKMSEGLNIEFLLVPDVVEMMTNHVLLQEIDGLPLLRIKKVPLAGWNGLLKRTIDFSFALVGLIVFAPIFLLIALLIRLDSKGKIFYKQKRVGLDGHEFDMIKFRSMREGAEKKSGPVWAQPQDDRVTRVGRFLRRFSIDELPQLWNVVKGEMSLIGPRPERPFFIEKFRGQIPRYLDRHRVKSGMTGWAQVNGLRGQAPIEERTEYDIYYIENWSLAFDVKIILKTLWTVILGKDSY
jgi:exopolysaccharide biosynthesis polyprenyl glycosylphosphotransferase